MGRFLVCGFVINFISVSFFIYCLMMLHYCFVVVVDVTYDFFCLQCTCCRCRVPLAAEEGIVAASDSSPQ